MNGVVDEELRALLEVRIAGTPDAPRETIQVWIDTAFNGGLVLPRVLVERLGLRAFSSTVAVLADGSSVELPTYTCYLEWFGGSYRTQAVANDGATPLLGTALLNGHDLTISYSRGAVTLE